MVVALSTGNVFFLSYTWILSSCLLLFSCMRLCIILCVPQQESQQHYSGVSVETRLCCSFLLLHTNNGEKMGSQKMCMCVLVCIFSVFDSAKGFRNLKLHFPLFTLFVFFFFYSLLVSLTIYFHLFILLLSVFLSSQSNPSIRSLHSLSSSPILLVVVFFFFR